MNDFDEEDKALERVGLMIMCWLVGAGFACLLMALLMAPQ